MSLKGRLHRAWRRRLAGRPVVEDALIAAAFAALAAVTQLSIVAPLMEGAPPGWAVVVWALAYMAPLALRRRWPLAVAVVMTLHFLVYWASGQDNDVAGWLGLGAGIYAAAAHGRRPAAAWTLGGCWAGFAAALVVDGVASGARTAVQMVGVVLFGAMPFVLGWSLGSMTRRLREYRAALQEQNVELLAGREANARRAVLEERVRVARELHDVVAHHVSLMTVQAAAARRMLGRRPEEALRAMTAVEEAGRGAIADLQQLVGVLRRPDDARDLAPQPTLRELPALADHVEQAGLPVRLVVDGEPLDLPAGIELSAYRIVQEALTNSLKHAGATGAQVTVCYADGAVEVEVLDDGHGGALGVVRSGDRTGPGAGRGLAGMRERVNLYGGRFESGPRPGGGFRVWAHLRANGTGP